jgi:hypothetical protein
MYLRAKLESITIIRNAVAQEVENAFNVLGGD